MCTNFLPCSGGGVFKQLSFLSDLNAARGRSALGTGHAREVRGLRRGVPVFTSSKEVHCLGIGRRRSKKRRKSFINYSLSHFFSPAWTLPFYILTSPSLLIEPHVWRMLAASDSFRSPVLAGSLPWAGVFAFGLRCVACLPPAIIAVVAHLVLQEFLCNLFISEEL